MEEKGGLRIIHSINFFLWGNIKGTIDKIPTTLIEDLKTRIGREFRRINLEILNKVRGKAKICLNVLENVPDRNIEILVA